LAFFDDFVEIADIAEKDSDFSGIICNEISFGF
jgi:hypothetical protein